jgi:methylase of polypeptide subunit release factors
VENPEGIKATNDRALIALGGNLREMGYRFTTITPETHRRVNARPENRTARRIEDVFGWSRPFERNLLPPHLVDLMFEAEIIVPGDEGFRSLVRLSSLDDLLLFHSAYPTIAPDSVFFGPDTYRFAAALKAHLGALNRPIERAMDIGCGTGAGGFLAARKFPAATIVLGDINDMALRLARVNAALNRIANVRLVLSDMLAGVDGQFDLICANPPYLVDPAKRAYRDGGGELGATLSLAIIEAAMERLTPGGTLLLYTGEAVVEGRDVFRAQATALMQGSGFAWSYGEMDPDIFGEELENIAYAQTDRIAAVTFTAAKPG